MPCLTKSSSVRILTHIGKNSQTSSSNYTHTWGIKLTTTSQHGHKTTVEIHLIVDDGDVMLTILAAFKSSML